MSVLYGDKYEAYSAGTEPTKVSPYAFKVMAEVGIDISKHYSKSVEEFRGKEFDYIATVCGHAKETCPYFPAGKKYLHESFEDPSKLAGSEEEIMAGFRRMMNQIRDWIMKNFD